MASLQGLSSAALATAKRMLQYKTACHWITFASAVASIFFAGFWLYFLAFVALLSELSSWFLSIFAGNKKALGQELLRLNILKQAYRGEMATDIAYLKARLSDAELKTGEEFDNPEYYSSNDSDPASRLIGILQESCFWSQHLYGACQNQAIKTSIGLAILVLLVIVLGLSFAGHDSNYSAPRLAILFLMLVPLWTEIGKSLSFGAASVKLELIDHRLDSASHDSASMLAVFADYNVVTSTAPLIPQKTYEKERDRLNTLWSERRERKSL